MQSVLIVQQLLRDREPLPEELADWVVDRLDGRRPQPRRKRRFDDWVRDILIAVCVSSLVDKGFTATRKKRLPMETHPGEASAEGRTACDAVGVALKLNYKKVEKVWTDADPELRATVLRNKRQVYRTRFLGHTFALRGMA